MSQVLYLGDDRYLTVRKTIARGGTDPVYAMMGGKRVLVEAGTPYRQSIHIAGPDFNEYYYENGRPLDRMEDAESLPEPYRTKAVEFVTAFTQAPEEMLPALEAVVTEKPTVRKRGRPKKAEKIEVTDEESYRKVFGTEE